MVFYIKREGNSLQGQWLGLRTFTAKGPNSIASLKTKTQKQSSMDRKKKKKGNSETQDIKDAWI